VIREPSVSCVMEIGPPSHSRNRSPSRTSSPNAAKRGADTASLPLAFELSRIAKVFCNELHDHTPTLLVRRKRLRPARERNFIETGFSHGQLNAVRRLLQCKDNQRRWLARVVDIAFDRAGMPAERK